MPAKPGGGEGSGEEAREEMVSVEASPGARGPLGESGVGLWALPGSPARGRKGAG